MLSTSMGNEGGGRERAQTGIGRDPKRVMVSALGQSSGTCVLTFDLLSHNATSLMPTRRLKVQRPFVVSTAEANVVKDGHPIGLECMVVVLVSDIVFSVPVVGIIDAKDWPVFSSSAAVSGVPDSVLFSRSSQASIATSGRRTIAASLQKLVMHLLGGGGI